MKRTGLLLPYGASCRRVSSGRAAEAGDSEAAALEKKELTRCLIEGNAPVLQLSVPVEGSNRALRTLSGLTPESIDADSIILSEHGHWRRAHTSAWETAYRSMPFFEHYAGPLLSAIATARTLGELLRGAAEPIRQVCTEPLVKELTELQRLYPERIARLREERCDGVNDSLSAFDLLFRLGPETIFSLWPAL